LQAHSLAIFDTPDSIRTFRLATAITDTTEVSDRFHLKPLLRAIAFPQNRSRARLISGRRTVGRGVRRSPASRGPRSLPSEERHEISGSVILAPTEGAMSYDVVDKIADRAILTGARFLGVRRADTRILIDRLWPREVKKSDAAIDRWIRDIAPSTALRKWFGHDPARWQEFRRRYAAEIHDNADPLAELRAAARKGPITLVFAARDEPHNDAVVLRDVRLGRQSASCRIEDETCNDKMRHVFAKTSSPDPREVYAMNPDIDRFYRTLVHETSDAIVYADSEGRIAFWNKGAERIFGFAAAEAIGKSLDIIIPETLRKRHWDGYAKTVRTGKSRYAAGALLAVPALRRDGARISVEFTILPFRDRRDRIIGIAAILRDVTKQFEEMKVLRKEAARRKTSGSQEQLGRKYPFIIDRRDRLRLL
jgi:PAS domain S-box-containing protein